MIKIPALLITFLFLLSSNGKSQSLTQGSLVIVGGGLEYDNKSIFNQLIGLAGGVEKATFAIVPSASGTPVQSYVYFKNILISYGVKPANIHLIPIAMMDDDSTKDVNESTWAKNGNDPKLAATVKSCNGIWFSGGDQLRTTRSLYLSDGSRTAVLQAIWEVYQSGGIVGGTSAGAAIMSEVMIGGGTSIAALMHGVISNYKGDDFPEDTGVFVTRGLGFFPGGIVDQHFNQRARIARLVMTLMNNRDKYQTGFGIDENTAIILHGKQNSMTVAGTSGVTIIDTKDAGISYVQAKPLINNLFVSYLEEGDSYDFTTGKITPADGKVKITGREIKSLPSGQAGILSTRLPVFRDFITTGFIDNPNINEIQSLNFIDQHNGFLVTCFKLPFTQGFETDKPDRSRKYTITDLRMDIAPVDFSINPIK